MGSAPGAAFFFVTYEEVKSRLRVLREDGMGDGSTSARGGGKGWIEPVEHMVAASVGEVAACAVRVPTEVVKQRAQAAQYPSSMAALRFILAQRGDIGTLGVWREMYRGWSITILREVPFTAIQFPLWEGMKAWRRRLHGRSQTSATESGIFGSIAGAVAAGLTTPLDVLKTRMMLAKERQAAMSLFVQLWRESGPKAFIAGLGPRVMWISAGGTVFLGTYQWALNAITGIT